MQVLFPKMFPEGVTFTRTFAAIGGIHIGELPNGGFARINGEPIQSKTELKAVLFGETLKRAQEWFDHREDPAPEAEPPGVTWKRGQLVYVESGAPLTSHAEIIQAFPEESPMQHAALEWFGQQQVARKQAKEQATHGQDRLMPSKAPMVRPRGSTGLPQRDITA